MFASEVDEDGDGDDEPPKTPMASSRGRNACLGLGTSLFGRGSSAARELELECVPVWIAKASESGPGATVWCPSCRLKRASLWKLTPASATADKG